VGSFIRQSLNQCGMIMCLLNIRPSIVVMTVFCATVIVTAYAPPTYGQQQQQRQQPASDMPSTLERQGNAPGATVSHIRSGPQVTETRQNGHTSAKVQTEKRTYHLKPNTSNGSALPGDGQTNTARGAQWKLLEFDP
jgi:hypothetical protein